MAESKDARNPLLAGDQDDIDILAIGAGLWRYRRLVAGVSLVGTLASAAISFSLPNVYTATATIMPADSSSDRVSAALSSLGALGGLASQAGVGMKGTVLDKFVAILNSRTLAERVATKHNLLPTMFADRWDADHKRWLAAPGPLSWLKGSSTVAGEPPTALETYRVLSKVMYTTTDPKSGLLQISVDYADPKIAADIANHYVIELNDYLQGNSFTSMRRNREFLEGQVKAAAADLALLERSLKAFQEEHKLVSLDAQTQATIQAYANLKSQLATKEMELQLQVNSVSEHDVQLIALKQEIAQLKSRLSAMENGTSGGLIGFKDAPALGMRSAQLQRDLVVKQKLFELLTQQYELAKIDEAKEALSFQVLDRAVAPDGKSKPKRPLIIIIGMLVSAFVGLAAAIVIEGIKKLLEQSPTWRQRRS